MEENTQRKLFIGGLKDGTQDHDLRNYFSEFGAISTAFLVFDKMGVSRGFGFVAFSDPSHAMLALKRHRHVICGKEVEVKPSEPMNPAITQEDQRKKIFVGGLPHDITKQKLRTHFEQFGPVKKVDIKENPKTGRKRGFGYITFHDEGSVEAAMIQERHPLDDNDNIGVEVKRATPKEELINVAAYNVAINSSSRESDISDLLDENNEGDPSKETIVRHGTYDTTHRRTRHDKPCWYNLVYYGYALCNYNGVPCLTSGAFVYGPIPCIRHGRDRLDQGHGRVPVT